MDDLSRPSTDGALREWIPVGAGALGAAALVGLAYVLWSRRAGGSSIYYAGPVVPGASVLSRFGTRTKAGVVGHHDGVDLQAPRGTPVHAAGAGVVMGAWADGEVRGYGNLVIIKHKPGEGTLYSHMDSIDPAMRVGAAVAPGQVVGKVGCTDSTPLGFDCGSSHLHMEVFLPPADNDRPFTHFTGGVDGVPPRMDPQAWAQAHGIRLF